MMPRVIYTAGVWDFLHRGHVNLLWRSKQLGDVLVVGVVSDEGTLAYKHQFPVQNQQQRMRNVRQLAFVDVVIEQRTTDPSENLDKWRPDVMTHGDDWMRLKEGHETLERLGIAFVLLPYTPAISSSLLRAEMVETAP